MIASLPENTFDGLTALTTLYDNSLSSLNEQPPPWGRSPRRNSLSSHERLRGPPPWGRSTFTGTASHRWRRHLRRPHQPGDAHLYDNSLSRSTSTSSTKPHRPAGSSFTGRQQPLNAGRRPLRRPRQPEPFTSTATDLTALPATLFEDLDNSLQQLVLTDNSISTLPDMVFAGLTGLKGLDLSCNSSPRLTEPRTRSPRPSPTSTSPATASLRHRPTAVRAKLNNIANLYISEANTECLLPDDTLAASPSGHDGSAFDAPGASPGYGVTLPMTPLPLSSPQPPTTPMP